MTWTEGENAARIPLTEDAVLDLLRQHFAEVTVVDLYPHVPPSKELAARRAHVTDLPPHERILALCDTRANRTPAGEWLGPAVSGTRHVSAHEGFVVTTARVCWKNAGEPAGSLPWTDVDPERLVVEGSVLSLGDEAQIALDEPGLQDACANAFHVLAVSGQNEDPARRDTVPEGLAPRDEAGGDADGATTAPTRHAVAASFVDYASHAEQQRPDFSCWHCLTPLYETTPECAFCGAAPSTTGWLRTG